MHQRATSIIRGGPRFVSGTAAPGTRLGALTFPGGTSLPMSGDERDLGLARDYASRIVAAGQDRVRRVVLIGSRARGTARPDSDVDLVILEELRPEAQNWRTSDCAFERDRIRRELGATAGPSVELWVRTTDQYEEARGVVGTIEWLVELEGIVVYDRPVTRKAVPRLPPDAVRREYVMGWMAHALRALQTAVAFENAAALASAAPRLDAARAAMERAATGLMVHHGVWADKRDGLEVMLERVGSVSPEAARQLRDRIGSTYALSAWTAHAAVQEVVRQLSGDPRLGPRLVRIRSQLERPVVFLNGAPAPETSRGR